MNVKEAASPTTTTTITCQILVIGPYQNRLENVLSLLLEGIGEENTQLCCRIVKHDASENVVLTIVKHETLQINLELLPCVATFDHYYDASRNKVPYMKSIRHFYYNDTNDTKEYNSSLAPFFDNNNDDESSWGIIAAVAGCGIHEDEHINMIQQFINAMSFNEDETNNSNTQLSVTKLPKSNEGNQRQQQQHHEDTTSILGNTNFPIGPRKMAQFVVDEAQKIIEQRLLSTALAIVLEDEECIVGTCAHPPHTTTKIQIHQENDDIQDIINPTFDDMYHDYSSNIVETTATTTTKYACKICRFMLFNQNDLQDPHQISMKKVRHVNFDKFATNRSKPCESVFLAKPMSWMDNEIFNRDNIIQGKFNCPKCSAKIGSWNWSGGQCSCGSWVTPAIQILGSRVDTIKPPTVN